MEARKSRTAAINNVTFNFGGVTDPATGDDTYVYVLAIDKIFFNAVEVFAVGIDGTPAHRGEYTNVNTLIVGDDCETVITSHPGMPSIRQTPNPNYNGTPKWWRPTFVLPL